MIRSINAAGGWPAGSCANGVELQLHPRGNGFLRGDLQRVGVHGPPGQPQRFEQLPQGLALRKLIGLELEIARGVFRNPDRRQRGTVDEDLAFPPAA